MLFGFISTLGSTAIQTSMFIINLAFVRPDKNSCITDTSLNADIYADQLNLWNTLTVTHILCAVLMTTTRGIGPGMFLFANAALTIINLVQLVTLVFSSQYLIEQFSIREYEFTDNYKQFNFWCAVEIGIMMSTLFSNAIFLLLRSFFQQRFFMKVPEMLRSDDTDYIVS